MIHFENTNDEIIARGLSGAGLFKILERLWEDAMCARAGAPSMNDLYALDVFGDRIGGIADDLHDYLKDKGMI